MPLAFPLIERWLPQYSQFTARDTYRRHSSFSAWSRTPFLNRSRQELAKNQKHAFTCARIAELSGRGVPSRRQRSISARIASSICTSPT